MRIGKCFVGYDFILILIIFYLLDSQGLFICALLAAIIHEMGHIIAIALCGAKIDAIYLGAYGAKIEMKQYPIISYKREIIIALAGPLAGAIVGVILGFAGNYTLSGLNLVLSLFNLLPALPLDGGRALKYTGLLFFDELWQIRISRTGNIISAVFLISLCIYVSINLCVSPGLCIFTAFTASNFLKELFE